MSAPTILSQTPATPSGRPAARPEPPRPGYIELKANVHRKLLNRSSDQNLVAPKQIETALGYGIHHTFSADYRTVSTALNSGVPLALTNHSELAGQFDSFTRHLVGIADVPKAEPEKKRVFLGMF